MKEDLKTILYVGLGMISETNDKMKEMKDDLYKKGKELYEKGIVANEELKHNIHEAIKEKDDKVNKNDILKDIDKLSLEERKELIKLLNKKDWVDVENEEGENRK